MVYSGSSGSDHSLELPLLLSTTNTFSGQQPLKLWDPSGAMLKLIWSHDQVLKKDVEMVFIKK